MRPSRAPAPSRRPPPRPPGPAGRSSPPIPPASASRSIRRATAYSLTIVPPATGNYTVEITTTPSSEGDDYDLFVNGPSRRSASAARPRPAATRRSSLTNPAGRHLQRQHAGLARRARRHVHRQGDARRRRRSAARRHQQRPLRVRPDRRAGDGRGTASRRRRRLRAGRARRGEGARRDPELPAPRRADPARPGLERRPVPALRRRDARQPRAQLLQQHEAVHRPVRVHVEAAVRLRARRRSRRASSTR